MSGLLPVTGQKTAAVVRPACLAALKTVSHRMGPYSQCQGAGTVPGVSSVLEAMP